MTNLLMYVPYWYESYTTYILIVLPVVIISLIVSIYTTLLIGPSVYGTFLDIKQTRFNATLSRNDSVNKVIKKKVARARKTSK